MTESKQRRLSTGILQPDPQSFPDERMRKINSILPKFRGPAKVADQPDPGAVLNPQLAPKEIEATQLQAGDSLEIIELHRLYVSDVNPRQVTNSQRINEFALSLIKDGQIQPLIVTPHPTIKDGFMIVEGHTRRLAALKVGIPALQCLVRPFLTGKERYIAARTSNAAREGLTAMDDGLAWAELVANGVFGSFTEINEALGLGLSKPVLSRYQAFSMLPPECLQLMQEAPEKFSANAAADLRRAVAQLGLKQTLGLITGIVRGDLTPVHVLKRLRSAQAAEEVTGPRAKPETWQVLRNSKQLARIRRVGASRIVLDLAIAAPAEFEAKLSEALARLLDAEHKD